MLLNSIIAIIFLLAFTVAGFYFFRFFLRRVAADHKAGKMKPVYKLFILFGTIACILSLCFSFDMVLFIPQSNVVTAKVIKNDNKVSNVNGMGNLILWTPVFAYTDPISNKNKIFTSKVSSNYIRLNVGDEAELLVNLKKLNMSPIENDWFALWGISLILGAIGVIFLGSGILGTFLYNKYHSNSNIVQQNMYNKTILIFIKIIWVSLILGYLFVGYNIYSFYHKTNYDKTHNKISEFEKALALANKGNAVAQFKIAIMYQEGDSVEKDFTKAVVWYKKSANQGNPDAQNNLGIIYAMGQEEVAKDYTQALKWFQKAAEQNHASAQLNLGIMYDDGLGVIKDYKKAAKLYEEAAEQGIAIAQYNIGFAYENGYGVSKDYKKAINWYKKAAAQGLAEAKLKLESL